MKLIHIRLAFVLLGFFFFAISGVILISAYAKAENLNGVFSVERMVVLVCGLVHLVLAIPLYVSLHYTTKILSYYLSQNDPLFVALWDLLGMENIDDGRSSKIDEESFLEATTPGDGIKTPWGGWFVSSTDLRDDLRIHDKQEVEVIKTKIPSVTRDKLLSAISAQPATIVDVLKINQLGELCWPLEPKGEKEPANKEELDQMLNAMERLKSTRINASLKVEQPFVSSQQASGQERLLQTETVRIPLSLKIEDLATKDVATAAEMLKLDQIP